MFHEDSIGEFRFFYITNNNVKIAKMTRGPISRNGNNIYVMIFLLSHRKLCSFQFINNLTI